MKFLLDMGISIHPIPDLESDSHDAAHIADLSTGTLPDAEILARAREEGAIVSVTEGAIRVRSLPVRHP